MSITLTDNEWKKVKEKMPLDFCQHIEDRDTANKTKLEQITVQLAFTGKNVKPVTVKAEKLNDYWCISQAIDSETGKPHRSMKSLTHIPSGKVAISMKKRMHLVKLWNEVKHLDIHHSSLSKFSETDVMDFRTAVRRYNF